MMRCSPSCRTLWAMSITGSLCGSQSRNLLHSSYSRPSPLHRAPLSSAVVTEYILLQAVTICKD